MYERWGYQRFVPLPALEKAKPTPVEVASIALGYPLDIVPQEDREPFTLFFNHISTDSSLVPEECWDLNRSSDSLLLRTLPHLRLRKVRSTSSDILYYIIEPRQRTNLSPNWMLVLDDPVTVVQLFRTQHESTIYDIVRYLFWHGMIFSTCIPQSDLPPVLPLRSPPTLTKYPKDHVIEASEYHCYHDRLCKFFTEPHSRAAFGMGGIIWRLACAAINDRNCVENALLSGPSNEVSTHHTTLSSIDGEKLYDDSLTIQEQDFVCGVYKIATGKFLFSLSSHLKLITSFRARHTTDCGYVMVA